jgi:hypothetical protein
VALSDNQNSLRANPRGPTLLEDFILRENLTHFDHERIPGRIVHARATGAHGFFELAASLKHYTTAWAMRPAWPRRRRGSRGREVLAIAGLSPTAIGVLTSDGASGQAHAIAQRCSLTRRAVDAKARMLAR